MWKKKRDKMQSSESVRLSVVLPAVIDETEGENPLYRLLGGLPLVARTLQALNAVPGVGEIIVVVPESQLMYIADLVKAFELERVKKIICGRRPGLAAVAAGVYECERDAAHIAVHDPLRPFITADLLEEVWRLAQLGGAAAPAVTVKDTIKIVEDNVVRETPDRSTLYALQMPQIIESSMLKAALTKAMAEAEEAEETEEARDLAIAMERLGLPLKLAEGREENIRVSKATDIPAAETILAWRGYGLVEG